MAMDVLVLAHLTALWHGMAWHPRARERRDVMESEGGVCELSWDEASRPAGPGPRNNKAGHYWAVLARRC